MERVTVTFRVPVMMPAGPMLLNRVHERVVARSEKTELGVFSLGMEDGTSATYPWSAVLSVEVDPCSSIAKPDAKQVAGLGVK